MIRGGYQPQGGGSPPLPTTGSGVKAAPVLPLDTPEKLQNSFNRQRDFINRLKILRSLDEYELVRAGVVSPNEARGSSGFNRWHQFQGDPFAFLMKCDDPTADAIWTLLEERSVR